MTKEVRFNQAVNNDDGLLANSYARKYSLAYQDARILLDSDIKELKRMLENDGEITLGRLGYVSVGDENTINFSPLHTAEQTSRELGFVSVGTSADTKGYSDIVNNKHSECSFDLDRNYYIPVNKTAVKMAASLVLVFLVAISALLPSSGRKDEDRASVVPVKALIDSASISAAKDATCENMCEETAPIAHESEISTNRNGEQLKSDNTEKKFYLIVGTFRSESEARKFITMNTGNDPNLILVPSKTLFRVASAASDDKSELIMELNSHRFKTIYSEGWIWENKQ